MHSVTRCSKHMQCVADGKHVLKWPHRPIIEVHLGWRVRSRRGGIISGVLMPAQVWPLVIGPLQDDKTFIIEPSMLLRLRAGGEPLCTCFPST
jgi:hypothetical protein